MVHLGTIIRHHMPPSLNSLRMLYSRMRTLWHTTIKWWLEQDLRTLRFNHSPKLQSKRWSMAREGTLIRNEKTWWMTHSITHCNTSWSMTWSVGPLKKTKGNLPLLERMLRLVNQTRRINRQEIARTLRLRLRSKREDAPSTMQKASNQVAHLHLLHLSQVQRKLHAVSQTKAWEASSLTLLSALGTLSSFLSPETISRTTNLSRGGPLHQRGNSSLEKTILTMILRHWELMLLCNKETWSHLDPNLQR